MQDQNYSFSKYVNKRRWMSYYYQIKECVDSKCKSILLIGKGDGVIPAILEQILGREQEGTIIDTFDYDESLCPTYVGDIRDLSSIVKKKYDCVICCQVLEHLPWDYFESILQDIKRVCKRRFILSLPLHRYNFQLRVDICHLTYKLINIVIERRWVKNFVYRGEHYWEVGIHGHSKKNTLKIIKKYYNVERNYIVPENTYHWFVICKM